MAVSGSRGRNLPAGWKIKLKSWEVRTTVGDCRTRGLQQDGGAVDYKVAAGLQDCTDKKFTRETRI